MRKGFRWLSVLLALILVMQLSVVSFAKTNAAEGSIRNENDTETEDEIKSEEEEEEDDSTYTYRLKGFGFEVGTGWTIIEEEQETYDLTSFEVDEDFSIHVFAVDRENQGTVMDMLAEAFPDEDPSAPDYSHKMSCYLCGIDCPQGDGYKVKLLDLMDYSDFDDALYWYIYDDESFVKGAAYYMDGTSLILAADCSGITPAQDYAYTRLLATITWDEDETGESSDRPYDTAEPAAVEEPQGKLMEARAVFTDGEGKQIDEDYHASFTYDENDVLIGVTLYMGDDREFTSCVNYTYENGLLTEGSIASISEENIVGRFEIRYDDEDRIQCISRYGTSMPLPIITGTDGVESFSLNGLLRSIRALAIPQMLAEADTLVNEVTYIYDDAGRVTGRSVSLPTSWSEYEVVYEYDDAEGTLSYQYSNNGSDIAGTYSFDRDGRITEDSVLSTTSRYTNTYEYDAAGTLISFVRDNYDLYTEELLSTIATEFECTYAE